MTPLHWEWLKAVNDRARNPKGTFEPLDPEPVNDHKVTDALQRALERPKPTTDHRCWGKNAEDLLYLTGPQPWLIEAWVVELRERSGFYLIDWGYSSGIAFVEVVPRKVMDPVYEAVRATWPAFCAVAASWSTGVNMCGLLLHDPTHTLITWKPKDRTTT